MPPALAEFLSREEQLWIVGADLQKFTALRQTMDCMDRLTKLFGSITGETSLVCRWIVRMELTEEDYQACP